MVFSNKIRFPTTIHVHGLLYNKSSEGSPYNDGTPSTPATLDPANPFSAPPIPAPLSPRDAAFADVP